MDGNYHGIVVFIRDRLSPEYVFIRTLKEGHNQGKSIGFSLDGEVVIQNYERGLLEGPYYILKENGVKVKDNYVQSNRHGQSIWDYPNGSKIVEYFKNNNKISNKSQIKNAKILSDEDILRGVHEKMAKIMSK